MSQPQTQPQRIEEPEVEPLAQEDREFAQTWFGQLGYGRDLDEHEDDYDYSFY